MRPIILLFALSILLAPAATAAVPQSFTYQAVVNDSNGLPISNGTHSFRFRLYPLSNAVWPVWEETLSLTTEGGLLHATLGETVPFDTVIPSGTASFDRQYWLAVAIDGGEDVIRLPLHSAPYALVAGAVDDSTVTGPKLADAAVVRSINGLQDDLVLQGANGVGVSNVGNTITITGSGGGGGTGFWDLSGSAISNNNPGFVGVNRSTTISPAEYFGIRAPVSTGYGGMYINTDGGEGRPFYGYSVPGGSAWTYFDGANKTWYVNNVGNRLAVTNGGNVGIGTDSPTDKLQVAGIIHSTFGGFRFPDGTLQTTAGGGGGGGADSDWLVVGDDMYAIATDQVFIGTNDPSLNAKLTIEDEVRGSTVVTIRDDLFTELKVNGGTGASSLKVGFDQVQLLAGSGDLLRLTSTDDLRLEATGETDWYAGGALRSKMDTAGALHFYKNSTIETIRIEGSAGGGNQGGQIALYNDVQSTTATAVLDGEYGGGGGGALVLRNATGNMNIEIAADLNPGDRGMMRMYKPNGTRTLELDSEENGDLAQGGAIKVYNDAGQPTIELDGDYGNTNEGRVITDVLEITGGSDLSENFDVTSPESELKPGTVVCIDPHNPGRLIVAGSPYDRTVAGVVSGAGGVRPGMLMGQHGSEADGKHPVALTGRVYVRCDASNGPIMPGDMLTTSSTSGHAQRVDDFGKAQGAILGKAMTSLDSGRGLVLVLVTLQ